MALQELINSPAGISLALFLARTLSLRQGYWLADRLGSLLAGFRESPQVRAVEANQSMVSHGALTESGLHQVTKATFQSAGRCIYDLYRTFDNPKSILELVEIDSTLRLRIEEHREKPYGMILASLHFSNFDLVLRAAVLSGLHLQILAYPQPHYGYRLQNRIRKVQGLEITPISFSAMQNALRLLRNGGIVATAVDRPVNVTRYQPVFFGQPASLPVSYIQLALKAGVPVVVVSGQTMPDGHYCAQATEPIPMRKFKDPGEEVLWNTKQILQVIERIIRWDPKQWAMFYPVWPGAVSQN